MNYRDSLDDLAASLEKARDAARRANQEFYNEQGYDKQEVRDLVGAVNTLLRFVERDLL